MRKTMVVLSVALALILAGCGGGGGNSGGGTPPTPPPTPTIVPLTVTFTPIAPGIEQATQLPSGSLFVGQQAKINVTQNGTAVSGATLTVSLGTLSQTTYTAPDTSGSATISAKGTDGATGSATVNIVKPTAPTAVATIGTTSHDFPWQRMFFSDNTIIGGSGASVFSIDSVGLQFKKIASQQQNFASTQMQKIAVFGGGLGDPSAPQPSITSYDSTPALQKTSSCGFTGFVTGMAYDPSNNGIWLGIRTPSQGIIALADAVNFQINCSSVYEVMNGGQTNITAVMPFSGGLMIAGFQPIAGGVKTFIIKMDRNGNKAAETDYDGSSLSRPMVGSTVAVGPVDENGTTYFYVAGSKLLTNGSNLFVQKFDSNANPAWSNPYDWAGDINPSVASAYSITTHPKGGVIIAGGSTRPNQAVVMLDFNITDAVLFGVKPDGTTYWNPARFNTNASTSVYNKASFQGIAVQPGGNYVWVSGPFMPYQQEWSGLIAKISIP